jgi:hypothetical protein
MLKSTALMPGFARLYVYDKCTGQTKEGSIKVKFNNDYHGKAFASFFNALGFPFLTFVSFVFFKRF